MATNVFFRNYDNTYEQNLIDDLVIESIGIYGVDLVYITSSLPEGTTDEILNENDLRLFDTTYDFEAYVKNVDGFEGEGDFLSKFGLQIRDSVTFTVAIRTFERFVTKEDQNLVRPKEGDLIYFPLNEKMFVVQDVEHESVFYQSGALQVYDMRCELFEYSGERFATGRDNVDTFYSEAGEDFDTATTLSKLEDLDAAADNLEFETVADDIIDFSEIDPFSETIDIQDR
mgnify:CR=1 FL=1|jgi:hypothetical protein